MLIRTLYLLLVAYTIYSCGHSESSMMFGDHNRNDSFFILEQDSTFRYNQKWFTKFKLNIVPDWKILTGYLSLNNSELYYLNNNKQLYFLSNLDLPKMQFSKAIFSLDIKDKYGNSYSQLLTDSLKVYSLTSLISQKDTIHRILIHHFHVLKGEDNLLLYITKSKGIVGSAAYLIDSTIFFYQGNIFSDTNLTLTKKNLILQ